MLKFYRFEEKDYIYKRKYHASEMFIIVKGTVHINAKNSSGKMVRLRIHTKGEHFGESDMLYAPKHLHTEEA